MAKPRYSFKPMTLLVRWLQFAMAASLIADLLALAANLNPTASRLGQIATIAVDLAYISVLPVLFWVYQVSVNAHSFKPKMNHSVGAALGWYIVPLASLGMPYVTMAEIWTVSGGSKPKNPGRGALLPVQVWWGLFVIHWSLVSYAQLFGSLGVAAASALVGAALAVASFILITRLHKLQLARHTTQIFEDSADVAIVDAQAAGAGQVA